MLRHLPYAAALLATVMIAGCGGARSEGVVARVAGTAITHAALDHWTSVWMGGRVSSGSSGAGPDEPLRQRALQFLISAQWLSGEAADRRMAPSEREVSELVAEHERKSFAGGQAELHEFLEATGQTVADMELEARMELISSRLHELAVGAVGPVTPAQIAEYYHEHSRAFLHPEVREVRVTNRKSAAAAERLTREVRAGTSFAERSQPLVVERPNNTTAQSAREPLAKAIYAARLNDLIGPVKQGVDYWVFEVERAKPPTMESLGHVSAAIRGRLRDASLRQALTLAVAAWRARWTARTSCDPAYVVQKCRQYRGPRAPEDRLDFN